MIKEVQAKTILASVKQPDTWFGLRYNMNIYRGCPHQCIYCDSRSECYGIEDFREVLVKINAPELLRTELARKRIKGIIGTGSMNDPYSPVEAEYGLVGRALEIIAEFGFGVHIITKSDLVVKDLERLRRISSASVSFTVTTSHDELAFCLEPGAPPPSVRFAAMRTLAAAGVNTGVTLMPVLPFLEDNVENIAGIVARTRESGGRYIVAGLGVTLRDRQRSYFYQQLDRLFPGLSAKYRTVYGARYDCACPEAETLRQSLAAMCGKAGLATRFTAPPAVPEQGKLSFSEL